MLALASKLTGVVLILGSAAVVGYQCFVWLRTGHWMPLPLTGFLGETSRSQWVGLDKVFDWLFGLPASLWLLVMGFCFVRAPDA